MNKVELFKEFVKKHPNLIKFIHNNKMTWQKFYELYDLYGEDDQIWNQYIGENNINEKNYSTSQTISNFVEILKKIDLDNLQEGISSIERVVGVLSDLTSKKKTDEEIIEYRPRPLYRHFDD